MDRVGANFQRCVDMMVERLNAKPVPVQLPWGAEEDFIGVIDVVAKTPVTVFSYTVADSGGLDTLEDIADELATLISAVREVTSGSRSVS